MPSPPSEMAISGTEIAISVAGAAISALRHAHMHTCDVGLLAGSNLFAVVVGLFLAALSRTAPAGVGTCMMMIIGCRLTCEHRTAGEFSRIRRIQEEDSAVGPGSPKALSDICACVWRVGLTGPTVHTKAKSSPRNDHAQVEGSIISRLVQRGCRDCVLIM